MRTRSRGDGREFSLKDIKDWIKLTSHLPQMPDEGVRMSKHKKIERKKELDRKRKRRKERNKLRAKGLLPSANEKKA